jgi:hypothetical protein
MWQEYLGQVRDTVESPSAPASPQVAMGPLATVTLPANR